jgi:capsid portal protein
MATTKKKTIESDDEIFGFLFSTAGSESVNTFVSASEVAKNVHGVQKQLAQKGLVPGSTQSEEEVGSSSFLHSVTVQGKPYIEPPYDPQAMANFLEVDETHFRAVHAKVSDIVGKPYVIKSFLRIIEDKKEAKKAGLERDEYILSKVYRKESKELENFIERANPNSGFLGVLKCAAMDFEAVGWAAIEVIRSYDKRIHSIAHVPAARVRVLKGRKGFVEIVGSTNHEYRYYQNFGEKVGSDRTSVITNETTFIPFDPSEDSYLDDSLRWNLVDKSTGNPLGSSPSNLKDAANEILFIPKVHPNTVYYGYSDIVPALTALIVNCHIKEYVSQFFENNAIPRYMVILKGGKVDPEFHKVITEYFKNGIKGNAHQTAVLSLPGNATRQVELELIPLSTEHKEADFLETERHNSKKIQVAHGTPPAILGVAEHSELGSGKGLSQAELYKDRIVTPAQYFWQEKLYQLTSKGLGITNAYIGFTPLDIRDRYMQMQVLTGYLDRGIYDVNDCLEELDKPPVSGGNVHFIKGSDKFIKIEDLEELESTVVENQPAEAGIAADESENNSQVDEQETDLVSSDE